VCHQGTGFLILLFPNSLTVYSLKAFFLTIHYSPLTILCVGKPEKVRTSACLVVRLNGFVHIADKQAEVVFSGPFFFDSFLLGEQKK